MRNLLKNIVYQIIKNNNSITKDEIKNQVYDFAVENKILTKEFVIAFGDIGWVFQTLRQEDELIKVDRVGRHYFWSVI